MSQLHDQGRPDGAAEAAIAACAAAARVRGWLLSPRVQLGAGPHAGAVAGAFDRDGLPRYVYPEITGYFMHWLAELPPAASHEPRAAAATRAADWASRQFEHGALPKTRSYLGAATPDWRNDAVFFFDLAMLMRGLCAAAESRLIALPDETLRHIAAQLERFVTAAADIVAARPLHADAALPPRWSTLGGPFEVKAASRVAMAADHVDLPARLLAACERLIDRHADTTASIDLGMLHPALYFAEGMIVARPMRAPAVAQLLERALRLQHADGSLPEAENDSAVLRSDIIAQALRIGVLLRAQGVERAPDAAVLARLAAALQSRIAADGSVCFRADIEMRESNVWCSLFAEQALRWYGLHLQGSPPPAAVWLV